MKKLTILVVPVDWVGHVNACTGTTKALLDRGHRVIFLLEEAFSGKLASQGFDEHIISLENRETDSDVWSTQLLELGIMGPGLSLEEKYLKVIENFNFGDQALDTLKQLDGHVKLAIAQYKPDLIFIDGYLPPCIYYSGIPWINHVSITALFHCSNDSEELPPASSGFPTKSDRNQHWIRFKNLNLLYRYSKKLNDFIEHQLGYPRYPKDHMIPYDHALFTVYANPQEYNYPEIRSKKGWFNIEVFNKNFDKNVMDLKNLVPNDFWINNFDGKWRGKWIYLSMGSMGSVDLGLMARILNALGDTNHKIIVSKGPRHHEFELPENAWGERFLPQMSLLPQMDLIITHGGNNTVTESFALGKPMIVLPLFGDQYDNAQRIHEMGYALRIDPYEFTKGELIEAVDKLLNDEELKERLTKASKKILSENRHKELAEKIEKILCNRD